MTEAGTITIDRNGAMSSIDLSDQQSIEAVKTLNTGEGITSITYTAGDGVQQSIAISGAEVEEFLEALGHIDTSGAPLTDKDVEGLSANVGGLLKAISAFANSIPVEAGGTPKDLEIASQVDALLKKPIISDFDIRELMKLLIKAFSQLMNAQRQVTLNTITNIVTALEAKIQQMEKARDENYKAAIATAAAGIVAGVLQVVGGAISMAGAGKSAKPNSKVTGEQKTLPTKASEQNPPPTVPDTAKATKPETPEVPTADAKMTKTHGEDEITKRFDFIGSMFGSAGSIANSIASIISAHFTAGAKEAEIQSAIVDALMEVLRKMQDEGSSEFKQLIQFVSTLLQMLHELQQNASATEKTIVQA